MVTFKFKFTAHNLISFPTSAKPHVNLLRTILYGILRSECGSKSKFYKIYFHFAMIFFAVKAEVYNQKQDIKTSNQPAERRDNFEVKRSWKFNLFNFNFI